MARWFRPLDREPIRCRAMTEARSVGCARFVERASRRCDSASGCRPAFSSPDAAPRRAARVEAHRFRCSHSSIASFTIASRVRPVDSRVPAKIGNELAREPHDHRRAVGVARSRCHSRGTRDEAPRRRSSPAACAPGDRRAGTCRARGRSRGSGRSGSARRCRRRRRGEPRTPLRRSRAGWGSARPLAPAGSSGWPAARCERRTARADSRRPWRVGARKSPSSASLAVRSPCLHAAHWLHDST